MYNRTSCLFTDEYSIHHKICSWLCFLCFHGYIISIQRSIWPMFVRVASFASHKIKSKSITTTINTHKGQCREALKFSLICTWINGWVNSREAGDLIRYRAHYDVTVMSLTQNKCDASHANHINCLFFGLLLVMYNESWTMMFNFRDM